MVMRRIKLPTLWERLHSERAAGMLTPERVLDCADRVAADIKRASDAGFLYWEMVPVNIFAGENTDFTYFDQELRTRVSESDDFKAVILRAVELFKKFLPGMDLYSRYGLTKRLEHYNALSRLHANVTLGFSGKE
jgi:hypothetical protein